MGLDTIEMVLRIEETFAVSLPDADCATVVTVGDLYKLILAKLDLPYEVSAEIEGCHRGHARIVPKIIRWESWTTPDVWLRLKAIIQDQLQITPAEIKESAEFIRDLRCD